LGTDEIVAYLRVTMTRLRITQRVVAYSLG
jgi:hypothetical protein